MLTPLDDYTVLIPVYDSDISKLETYVSELRAKSFPVILVNDGSQPHISEGLRNLSKTHGCTLIEHDRNRGKGAALKTGFSYVLNQDNSGTTLVKERRGGVICVDSDGQHLLKDLIRLQEDATTHPDTIIFGARDFSSDNIPPKSKFGNTLTTKVMRLFYGLRITDTQTGLRYIPYQYLPLMCEVEGERFEYETNMLIAIACKKLHYREIPISTVYIDNNAGTHFRAVRDSARIYACIFGAFFKFCFSSISSAFIDFLVFTILIYLLTNHLAPTSVIFASSVVARIISSLYNYTFNHRIVFNTRQSIKITIVKYYSLALFILLMSAVSVSVIWHAFGAVPHTQVFVKIVVDGVLFLLSFYIQKRFIFR